MAEENQQPKALQRLTALVNRATQAGRAAYDVFNGRQFGPQKPLQPNTGYQEQRGGPRQFVYPSSSNLIIRPRQEYTNLTPFDQLRNLARLYPVSAMCVNLRANELSQLNWAITARNKKQQAFSDNNGITGQIERFFRKPDGRHRFRSWLYMAARETLEIDALSVYVRRRNDGTLYSLELLDGSTIKPLIDDRGRVLAFQQVIYGLPASNYIMYGIDAADEVLPLPFPGYEGEGYYREDEPDEWPQEIIYEPFNPHVDNVYGIAPLENVILTVNTALRKSSFDLAWFTDGNTPEMLLVPNLKEGETMTPDQVQEFEDWFNTVLEGNDGERRKAKFLAWNANPIITKPFEYQTVLDEWMLRLTCAAFDVTPSELGFTDDVNRATADSQENVNYRKGLKPLAKYFKEIFDDIIATEFGAPDLEFTWQYEDESEDLLKQAQVDQIYLGSGVLTADEVRAMRFADDVEGPAPAAQRQPPQVAQPDNTKQLSGPEKARQLLQQMNKASGEIETGVMVAFMLAPLEAQILALNMPGSELPEDLHITLAYLGEIPEMGQSEGAVIAALQDFARFAPFVSGQVNGYGRFGGNEGSGTNALYASFDAPLLPTFRQVLVNTLLEAGVEVVSNHGYTPHITLAYLPESAPTPTLDIPALDLTFGEVVLAWGDKHTTIPLLGERVTANAR